MTDTANKIAIIEPGAMPPAPAGDVRPFDPMALLDKAVTGGASLDMIDRLVSLGERMQAMKARQAFDAAIAAAKAEIPVIVKNRLVDFVGKTGIRTRYKHEDMAEIARTITPILARHGLSYRFQPFERDGKTWLRCIIAHSDGYREESESASPIEASGNKNAHQAISSGFTFTQRMMLKLALGLAAGEDDDGHASGGDDAPPAELVSEAQVAAITKAITFKGRTVEALCKRLGVESLADIYADKFSDVLAMIGNLSDAPTKEVGHD